jgi:hypothetical protein
MSESAKTTPEPWRLQHGYRGTTWGVVRTVRPGFVEYLNARGVAAIRPSRFRTEVAARAAIATAEARSAR